MNFPDFIKAKGPQALADALGKPINTVYGWTFEARIPRAVWPDLLLAYPELGMRDLLEMESARDHP